MPDALASEKEDLETRVEDLIYKGGSVAEHVAELQQQVNEAEAEAKEMEEILDVTQQKLARALKDVSEAEVGQTEALAEAASLLEEAGKVPELHSEIEKLKVDLASATSLNGNYESRIAKLEVRLESGNEGAADLNRKISDLERKLLDAESARDAAMKASELSDAKVGDLKARIGNLESSVAESNDHAKNAKAELDEYIARGRLHSKVWCTL